MIKTSYGSLPSNSEASWVLPNFGGQVNDTAGIENFITVKETTGSQFSANLAAHIEVTSRINCGTTTSWTTTDD
jgi:hypothetical protein